MLALLRLSHGFILPLRVHLASQSFALPHTTPHHVHHTARRPHIWHNRPRPCDFRKKSRPPRAQVLSSGGRVLSISVFKERRVRASAPDQARSWVGAGVRGGARPPVDPEGPCFSDGEARAS